MKEDDWDQMKSNLDVITLGELLIDFVSVKRGVYLKEAPGFEKDAGGAPANVTVACSRLGLKSGFIGKVGADEFGLFLIDALEKEGVDVTNVYLDKMASTMLAFVSVAKDGERDFIFYGEPRADMQLAPDEINKDYIARARVFHFGSISLASDPARSATLRAVNAAKDSGLTITYDPNLRLNLWESDAEAKKWIRIGLEKADVVKMDDKEAEFLMGPGVERAAEELLGYVSKVFISLGSKGCYYADDDSCGYSAPYRVNVRDTTGARDGFMGGVIYGILRKWKMEKMASFSNAVGALTTCGTGGIPSLPTLNTVLDLLSRGRGRDKTR